MFFPFQMETPVPRWRARSARIRSAPKLPFPTPSMTFFEVDSANPAAPPAPPKPAAPAKAPAPPAPAAPKASPVAPAAPKADTDDGLMSGMGDFDELFEAPAEAPALPPTPAPKKASAPPPPPAAKAPESELDELLADFDLGGQPAAAPAAKAPTPPKPAAPPSKLDGVEDLFDFSGKEDVPPDLPKTVIAPPEAQAKPVAAPRDDVSRPDEALEELFSEVSAGEAAAADAKPAEEEDVLGQGLGIEYKKRGGKLPKRALLGIGSGVVLIVLVAVGMARFTPRGFFGWTFGQAPKDGYVPPSARVLKQLNHRYEAAEAFFVSDTAADYQKAIAEYEAILKVDTRHSPTEARLPETILLMNDDTISSNDRKRITDLTTQAENFNPGKIETVRAKARMSLAEGKAPAAESLARRALTLDAKDLATILLLGEIALDRADIEGAEKRFQQALEIRAGDARARHYLATVYLQQGKLDQAEGLFRELATGLPPHPASEIELWRLLYSHRGQVEPAKEALTKLIQTQAPNLSGPALGRAWQSLAEIAEAQNDLPEAVRAMEQSVGVDRTSHSNGFHLGRLYLQQKDFEKAASQFGRASSLSPKTPDYLIYRGRAFRELGQHNEALTDLTKALEISPTNVEGLYQMGLTQRAVKRIDEAITTFETALKNDPKHLDSMVNLGELYLDKDNFAMARTHLRAAITLAPQSAKAHNVLGEVLLVTRHWDEALDEFKQAEAAENDNPDVLTNIGKTYLVMGNIEQAAKYFERALTIDSTRVETQVALGELQHRRREYTKALETYRRVLEMQPKDYDTRVKVAAVLIDQEAFQDAVTELQEASKWKPDYFPTVLHLGMAWRGLGNLDASVDELRKRKLTAS